MKEGFAGLACNACGEGAATTPVLPDEQRAIRIKHVLVRARWITRLCTLDEAEVAQQCFLRTVLGQPSLWYGPARGNAEVSRGK